MRRILIVDDNVDNLYLLRTMLQGHGFDVDEARHGVEALAKARRQPPDLVISDLLMPQMDGYALLNEWKADHQLRGIPFIVYTATYTEPKDEKLALNMGADGFMVKPQEPERFIKHVHEVLESVSRVGTSPNVRVESEEAVHKIHSEVLMDKLAKRTQQLEQALAELQKAHDWILSLNAGLEERVAERTSQLEAVNRELDAFSYSVSHDLRAPLRAVMGFSSIVLRDKANIIDQSTAGHLKSIHSAAERMNQLINDLLRLSTISRQQMLRRDLDLSNVAHEAVEALRQEDPSRKIQVTVHPNMRCDGDASLLRVVLVNLIGNAWKFTGKIDVPHIEVGAEQVGGETAYFVRDNGAGFDMKYADKLFAPFQRLHGPHDFEGTGIGLNIVKRIVNKHGGEVWAESAKGRGATFSFTLGQPRPQQSEEIAGLTPASPD